jgi:two-component system, NarL family, response regulator DesR
MIGGVDSTIRLLLADDQALVRGALAALLDLEADLEVVAEVGRGDEVVEAARRTRPDVALLDVEMPGLDGIAAAAALRAAVPACKVLMVTTFGRPGYLRRAMESGVVGFLVKDAPADELAESIRRTMAGERVIDPALAVAAFGAGPNRLTERERTVLRAARGGASIAEIATQLVLAEGTIRNYLSEAIQKLGAGNRVEAAQIAEEQGWL